MTCTPRPSSASLPRTGLSSSSSFQLGAAPRSVGHPAQLLFLSSPNLSSVRPWKSGQYSTSPLIWQSFVRCHVVAWFDSGCEFMRQSEAWGIFVFRREGGPRFLMWILSCRRSTGYFWILWEMTSGISWSSLRYLLDSGYTFSRQSTKPSNNFLNFLPENWLGYFPLHPAVTVGCLLGVRSTELDRSG